MIKTILRAGLLAAILTGAALADPILLTFTGPGTGLPGSIVELTATAVNTTGDPLNLDGIGITLASPFTDFDFSPFFASWPTSLGPGSQNGPDVLFTVTIPVGTAAGLYRGGVANLTAGADSLLASAMFDIKVTEVTANVPEPADTAGLLAFGIAAIALLRGRIPR